MRVFLRVIPATLLSYVTRVKSRDTAVEGLRPLLAVASGSVARVTPLCSFLVLSFRAVFVLRHESTMEWQAALRRKKRPEPFLPVRYRVAGGSDENPAVENGGIS